MKGQLHDHPLGELIREISDKRLSGALRLARERVKAAVYFDAGEIVYARSNLRLHLFGESLRRWKVVSEERLASLVSEGMTDAEIGAKLVAAGTLTDEELAKLRTRQCVDVLRPLLLWTDGEWNFDPRARLDEEVRVALDVNQLLLEGARRLPPDFVVRRLGNAEEMVSPVVAASSSAPTAELQLATTEAFILSRAETGALRVGELIMISGLPEESARQNIYALALAGLLKRSAPPQAFSADALAQTQTRSAATTAVVKQSDAKPVDEKKPTEAETKPPVEETAETVWNAQAELAALFTHAEANNYYATLDVDRQASPADIKRAYYTLAKRFHPDRFHRDADESLRTRIESAFAKIARAYEVLKDPKQRSFYDSKLKSAPKPSAAQTPSTKASSTPDANKQTKEYRAEDGFQQGQNALRQRNYVLAVTYFGEAARLMPNTARYRAYYGYALAREPRTRRQAEVELQASIALEPRNVSFRVMLAELYSELGLRSRAEGELERALAIDPEHTGARRMLRNLKF
ncbi:MAG TPA: DUF4388 domain-containing protein [Pyrinomonadaceae bacterium]